MGHEEITKIRLHGWKKRLAENNATPVVMLGVAIEGPKKGQIVALTTEERTTEEVRLFLMKALQMLS